jgi:hypothetical protein
MAGMDRHGAPARLARTLAIALIAGAIVPWSASAAEGDPAPASESAPTTDPAPPSDSSQVVAPALLTIDMNLYRPDAIVRQFKSYWCVPANAQTMVNLVLGRLDRSLKTQTRFAWHVKKLNKHKYPSRGNDAHGWAQFLDYWLPGDFHYRDQTFDTKAAAIDAIVESLDRTGHPVGIVVDHGSHAWTILGYRATMVEGDPSTKIVEGLYVSGSLYRARRTRDPWPYQFLTLDAFRLRFTKYRESSRSVVWEGKFVIVAE